MLSRRFYAILLFTSLSVSALGQGPGQGQIKQPGKPDPAEPQPDPVKPVTKACEYKVSADYDTYRIFLVDDGKPIGQTISYHHGGSNLDGLNGILDAAKKLIELGICEKVTFGGVL